MDHDAGMVFVFMVVFRDQIVIESRLVKFPNNKMKEWASNDADCLTSIPIDLMDQEEKNLFRDSFYTPWTVVSASYYIVLCIGPLYLGVLRYI
jgi:hypothetical protein